MKNKQLLALIYGWTIAFGIIFIASMILAIILRFTGFNEPTLSWVTLLVGLLALFVGGLVAGIKCGAKGWIIGGTIGLGFTLLVFLIQYLGYEQSFSLGQSIHHLGYVVAALIGGIFGVNLVSADES